MPDPPMRLSAPPPTGARDLLRKPRPIDGNLVPHSRLGLEMARPTVFAVGVRANPWVSDARVDAANGVQSHQEIAAPPRLSACATLGIAARRARGPPAKPEIRSRRGAREACEVDRELIGGERVDFVGPSWSAPQGRAISVEEPPDLREANARPGHHGRRFFRMARCLAVVLSAPVARAASADGC